MHIIECDVCHAKTPAASCVAIGDEHGELFVCEECCCAAQRQGRQPRELLNDVTYTIPFQPAEAVCHPLMANSAEEFYRALPN